MSRRRRMISVDDDECPSMVVVRKKRKACPTNKNASNQSEFVGLSGSCRPGAASPASSVSTNHSGSSNSSSVATLNSSSIIVEPVSNQSIGATGEKYITKQPRKKSLGHPTIYLKVVPKQKPVKLNNSTCIDSDSSEDSTDSEQEEVEASKPVKPMGCIQSRGTGVNKGNIVISEFSATIDDRPTEIREESPIVLRYKTPYFRANATVIMPPLSNDDSWTVGWIQACSHMEFINQYGENGTSSWEVPALVDQKIAYVSDSDGVSYPWYGSGTEIATIKGPTHNYTEIKVKMNDNFHPSVTWDVPISERDAPHLTKITRDQSFITWLAAINERTNRVIVLRAVRWHFKLNVEINPNAELGQRAKLVGRIKQDKPRIQNGANYIPKSAMVRPSANNSQILVWRPKVGEPVIVVPPKETYKDSNPITIFKGGQTMSRKPHMIREIGHEEMAKIRTSL